MDILELHGNMLDWLEETLYNNQHTDSIIVLTHHAPSPMMLSKNNYGNNENNGNNNNYNYNCGDNYENYYASDCHSLFKKPIKCWISGHTHSCVQISINDIKSVSNCLGYIGEKTNVDVNKYLII